MTDFLSYLYGREVLSKLEFDLYRTEKEFSDFSKKFSSYGILTL